MKKLFFALMLGLAATPAAADDKMNAARDFIVTCGKRLPETRKTVQILKDSGWRYESTDGDYHYYSQDGRRLLAATSVTASTDQACLAAVSKLDEAGALAIGRAAAKQLGFVQSKAEMPAGVYALWEGDLNGRYSALVATPPEDFGFMRGAALVLVQVTQ